MRLSQIVTGYPGRLVCDGEFHGIGFATDPAPTGFLTFLEREKFLPALERQEISCVLTTEELADKIPAHIRGVFACHSPKATLFHIHNQLVTHEEYVGPSVPTMMGEDCQISPLAYVDPENVKIGNRVVIEPFAVIRGRVTIGDDAVIRSGAIIGSKGFSFSKDDDGHNVSVNDAGQIIVGKNVDIFSNATVETPPFPWDRTFIGDYTKVDALAQVGHGCTIGENCLLAEGSCCCGNSHLGANTWIGVGAVVSNRIHVGANARVSLGAVVTRDVPDGQTVSGNFAIEHGRFLSHLKKMAQE